MDNFWIFILIIGAVASIAQKNQQKNKPSMPEGEPTLDPKAEWERRMREIFGHRVLGPDLPPVARVQQLFIRKIVLKVENNLSQYKINEILIQLQQELIADKRYKAVTIYYDIDPL